MLKKVLTLYFCLLTSILVAQAQTADTVLQVVYLIGNTATDPIPEVHLTAFQQEIKAQNRPFTIVHLGDIVGNQGLSKKTDKTSTRQLDQLLQLTQNKPQGNMYFVPGDKDWDNSGKEGWKNVRNLEKYLADLKSKARVLVPGNGCPGPEIIDIGTGLRLVTINTQWWMHPYRKPVEPDTDCQINTDADFLEELDDAISEAGKRNVLVVGHHPVISNGVYGGHMPLKKHLFPFSDRNSQNRVPLPLLGSIYAAYRQNIGTPRDMANVRYQDFKTGLTGILQENKNIIYAAAHDYSLQLNNAAENYHLVSGSFSQADYVGKNAASLVNAAKPGFSKVTYYASGKVTSGFYTFTPAGLKELTSVLLFQSACVPDATIKVPINQQFGSCVATSEPVVTQDSAATATNRQFTTIAAGPEFKASPFKKLFLGQLYRPSWVQPVQLPVFYLSQTFPKLSVVKVGGGLQTKSLRLQAPSGREYVFRSVAKEPVGVVPAELRHTIVTNVLREINPSAQPYGAVVVSRLLDATDILHVQPTYYVMGNDPALQSVGGAFAGLLGLLEERPKEQIRKEDNLGSADDIKKSYRFFRQLYQDHDNRVDVRAYGLARAFDIFINDPDRHAGNWRWAEYKNGNESVYRPIPLDRDQAFTRWEGLFFWLADREWASSSIQNFDEEISGIQSLTWTARHLDRLLLTSLTKEQWREIGIQLQSKMTDEVIDQAIAAMPQEVREADGQVIGRRLKTRRQHLPQALEDYYTLLARYVDVVGSNKNEYFKVERLPGATVRVQMFEKDKDTNGPEGNKPLFDRVLKKSETKEIRLYGLDGKDVFEVSGNVPASIRVRIIGGAGKDSIRDVSAVKSFRKNTLVYDNTDTKLTLGKESQNLTSDAPDINQYNREAFEYNTYNPGGSLIYNKSDGLGVSFGINYKRQRFRKPDYGSLYGFQARATQNGNLQLTSNILWRQVLGKFDIGTYIDAGQYFQYYNFFGLGNNTGKNEALYDANYYKARYGGIMSQVFVQRQFFRKSYIRVGPLFEALTTNFNQNTFLAEPTSQSYNTTPQLLAGLGGELSLDLRDKAVFTQRGLRFFVRHSSYQRLKNNNDYIGLTAGFADYYGTARIVVPITLGVRLGGAKNHGKDLPFFKYTSLGMLQNLRGYVINRFSGDASAYINTELRFHVGQVNNSFLPFRYGLITFFDRGKVWYQGRATGGWHDGYGGGIYIAPFAERFAFSFLLQHSREESILFQVGAGFRFDQ